MRKFLIAVTITSVAFFGGCAARPPVDPPSTVTVTASPSAEPDIKVTPPYNSNAETEYIKAIQGEFDLRLTEEEAQALINLGYSICGAAPQWSEILEIAIDENDLDAEFAAYLLGAAVASFCPEYRNDLLAWAESLES